MLIFELVYPGTWMDSNNDHEIYTILNMIEGEFTTAVLSFNCFDELYNKTRVNISDSFFEDELNRKTVLMDTILHTKLQEINELTLDQERNLLEEVRFEVDVIVKREKWQNGVMPRIYDHKQTYIYAKSFLFSLDTIGKYLTILSKKHEISQNVIKLELDFYSYFSSLKEVRNSAHHPEDRIRHIGKYNKPMEIKSINNNFINGSALIIDMLNNNRYGNTLADGTYAEVEVSLNSVEFVRNIIQELINCFRWTGPKKHYPS